MLRKVALAMLVSVGVAFAGDKYVYVGFGYFSVNQFYDENGQATSTPDLSSFNTNVGGGITFFKSPVPMGPSFGAKFDLQLANMTVEGVGISTSTGFKPQRLNLLLFGSISFFKGELGFQVDLGGDEYWPLFTDKQNALIVGLGGGIPFAGMMGSLKLNMRYFMTLPSSVNMEIGTIDYDLGDVLLFTVGSGYKIGLGELAYLKLGLDFIYRMKTQRTVGGSAVSGSDENNLSLLLYGKYKMGPLGIFLKLGASDEYGYYGFSLSGKNSPATRLGFTGGVFYSF